MVIELLKTAGNDLYYNINNEGDINVTINDFIGFEDDWNEIYREYNEELVNTIEEKIEAAADDAWGDFYRYYKFEDFIIIWGYASFDI